MTRPSLPTLVVLFIGILLIALPGAYVEGEHNYCEHPNFQLRPRQEAGPSANPEPAGVTFDPCGMISNRWPRRFMSLGILIIIGAAVSYRKDKRSFHSIASQN